MSIYDITPQKMKIYTLGTLYLGQKLYISKPTSATLSNFTVSTLGVQNDGRVQNGELLVYSHTIDGASFLNTHFTFATLTGYVYRVTGVKNAYTLDGGTFSKCYKFAFTFDPVATGILEALALKGFEGREGVLGPIATGRGSIFKLLSYPGQNEALPDISVYREMSRQNIGEYMSYFTSGTRIRNTATDTAAQSGDVKVAYYGIGKDYTTVTGNIIYEDCGKIETYMKNLETIMLREERYLQDAKIETGITENKLKSLLTSAAGGIDFLDYTRKRVVLKTDLFETLPKNFGEILLKIFNKNITIPLSGVSPSQWSYNTNQFGHVTDIITDQGQTINIPTVDMPTLDLEPLRRRIKIEAVGHFTAQDLIDLIVAAVGVIIGLLTAGGGLAALASGTAANAAISGIMNNGVMKMVFPETESDFWSLTIAKFLFGDNFDKLSGHYNALHKADGVATPEVISSDITAEQYYYLRSAKLGDDLPRDLYYCYLSDLEDAPTDSFTRLQYYTRLEESSDSGTTLQSGIMGLKWLSDFNSWLGSGIQI